MPVRFTCRLIAVRMESRKLRVEYGPIIDGSLVVFRQSKRMILPPDGELTDQEFEQWKYVTMIETGSSIAYEPTPIHAPLVEAKRTYEDVIPHESVRAVLHWEEGEKGEKALTVEVTNDWARPVPDFSLATVCVNQSPQPMQTGKSGVAFQSLGGSENMFTQIGFAYPDLIPGRPTRYVLNPSVLPAIRSRAAALSPEHHWIALLTDGYEFSRIPGSVVAAFLAQLDL